MAELQRTYGSVNLYGQVQGLKRKYAFDDRDTKNGYEKQNLKFDIKTSKDNIVTVQAGGLNFGNVRITPQDKDDKQTKDLDYEEGVYDKIPEDWQVFMGNVVKVEDDPDSEGEFVRKELIPYDAAKEVYENLEDGDVVFLSGSLDVNHFFTRDGEEVTNLDHNMRRIYKSNKEIDFNGDDFKPTSEFEQNLIINAVDLDKKEKKAYVQAYLVYGKDGEFVNYTFWVDGNKYAKLAKNLEKLEFGTQLKARGKVHSTVTYSEQGGDDQGDDWGDVENSFSNKRVIKDVDKSYEITGVVVDSIEEGKYSPEDFKDNSEDNSPFGDNSNGEWGDVDATGDTPFENDDDKEFDPFE